MADTYTLPVFTAADINSIVTAGQDGTYNITYTNLKSEQIDAIGAAFEAAMQKNLKSVALSGEYNDLIGAPSLPNSALETIEHEPDGEHQEVWTSQEVKEFSDVAFSGKASDLENDSGFLTSFTETDPVFSASVAANITNDDIENWSNKSNFSGNYNDLNGAPALPEDTDNQSEAYYTANIGTPAEKRKIKALKLVAFTNSYNSLDHKPAHLNDVINLTTFSNLNLSNLNNNKILTLGQNNEYILNFSGFQNNDGNSLSTILLTVINNHINYGKEIIIINSNYRYKIININRSLLDDNELNPSVITLDYISFNNNNYNTIRYEGDSFDESKAQEQLEDLMITATITGTLIFDYINDVIYCKIKNI